MEASVPVSTTDYRAFAVRGRNAWWRYGLTLVVAVVVWLTLMFLGGVALTLLHLMPPDLAAQVSHPTDPLVFFTAIGASFGALALGLMTAAALVQRKSPLDLIGSWTWRRFSAGAGAWLVLAAAASASDYLLAPHAFRWSAGPGTAILAVAALLWLPVQTFTEELIFRGWVTQGALLLTSRPATASVVAGLLFGLLHIPNGLPQAAGATLFGVAMSLIAIRTGGIAFSWGVHLVNNLLGAIVMVSSGDVFAGAPGLFTQTTPRLMWWDAVVEGVILIPLTWWVLRRPIGQRLEALRSDVPPGPLR